MTGTRTAPVGGDVQLVVIAKEPRPGFVKTRLCPPCTPDQAAAIAAAALADTLAAVAAAPAARRVLALDGAPGGWVPNGFEVIAQRGEGLGERLRAAFADVFATGSGPVVLVGMDTPQVTTRHFVAATAALAAGNDAVIGLAEDGGYWLIGMSHLHPDAFAGVPMSAEDTGRRQVEQLVACGYDVASVEVLRDVDTFTDACAIAAAVPGSRFAAAVGAQLGAHVAHGP